MLDRLTQLLWGWHVLLLLLGAGLFGVNAFLFTRGNSVFDGIVFVAAWACALSLACACLDAALG